MDKIQLIKKYRELTGCSLIDAKNTIEDLMRAALVVSINNHLRWDYTTGYDLSFGELKEYGQIGWELCAIYNNFYFFKRLGK